MKKFKSGPMRLRRVLGNLLTKRQILPLLVAAGFLPGTAAYGLVIDFTPLDPPPEGPGYGGSASFASGTTAGGAGAVYTTADTHPAGTGVFKPFLTYQAKGIESGYNTSQGGAGQGYLDTKRVPQWNHDLKVSDLAEVVPGFFGFELDANETGSGNINRILSIDDIRIYTSASDTANSVGDNESAINSLGTLRYAQNATLGVTANWVLIDASNSEGGSTSGSGSSDMLLLVPKALFNGAAGTDFVYFYTINGVHDEAAPGSKSDAGFEEWRAFVGPTAVPDGGSTLLLLGSALIPLGLLRARRENKA
jgi:hypothetical protein